MQTSEEPKQELEAINSTIRLLHETIQTKKDSQTHDRINIKKSKLMIQAVVINSFATHFQ